MTESAESTLDTEPAPADLSTEQLEEELTLSAYDVHHVRGRRYEMLLAEHRGRRVRRGRAGLRAAGLQPVERS